MKATIVIPNINGKGWLKDSIESVYAQTEQDFELIVVDNGSTDESLEQARGAKRIIADATFPLFTSGLDKFDKAVEEGTLDYVVGTNLTYRKPELLNRDWYVDVDVSKYAAYFIVALNHDMSVSSIIDPIKKIEALLASRK